MPLNACPCCAQPDREDDETLRRMRILIGFMIADVIGLLILLTNF